MKIIIFLLFFGLPLQAQEGIYKVKQLQSGTDLDSLKVAPNNPFITEVSILDKGLKISLVGGHTFVPFHKLNKKTFGKDSYTYSVQISEQWNVKFFIAPYPDKNSKPKLVKGIMSFTGFYPENPEKLTYMKLVFWDEQK